MSGILNRDLYGGTLHINGVTVIDADQNMCVKNAKIQGDVLMKGNITMKGDSTFEGDTTFVKDVTVCGVLKTDYIAEKSEGHGVVVKHNLCLDSGKVLKINGTQVVQQQQNSIGDVNTSNLNSVGNGVNSILQILRNHGLIQNNF